ncbi:8-amino-7-oxononanoate synthase [Mucilaginibacter sp. RS28]|uniref:8-amino-7-oxononanoate synthase n=1 Tax=Mucilaginibacter straminoryzae TaxID=2932774 RepID=A0A9X2BE99_9SPHI|nr:8-amino-7-oxononanoate synthase [Mucilaginibacter straminoryzae]MCJ8211188.1 8-amino-7-oxononanoate synthase [Mucilaginibacter straminoryzae]
MFYFSGKVLVLHPVHTYLQQKLLQREEAGNLRSLKPGNTLIDFASNDYLGFSKDHRLQELITRELENQHHQTGSTGSRLLTGNSVYAEDLERGIANIHNAEAGLLYNSGYDANLGLFSSIAQRGDTVIADELIHASIIDGIRLSNANRYTFKHNDLSSLEEKLKNAKGNVFVAVESVYSMDGDLALLLPIAEICDRYGAALIVDEAHAIGVFHTGLVDQLQLQEQVFVRVVTFGKAMGCHGAIVLGSEVLRNYLVNFSRSFIYTTAAPLHQLAAIKCAYQLLENADDDIDLLHNNIALLKDLLAHSGINIPGQSAVNCIITGNNEKAKALALQLNQAGIDVRPVLSPTVAAGTERLRICMHTYNTETEINLLAKTIIDFYA